MVCIEEVIDCLAVSTPGFCVLKIINNAIKNIASDWLNKNSFAFLKSLMFLVSFL